MIFVHTTSLYESSDADTRRRMAVARKTWEQVYREYRGRLSPRHQTMPLRSSRGLGDDRTLPFIRDLVDYAFQIQGIGEADAVILTNADTCFIPSLLPAAFEAVERGGCYYSPRYDHKRFDAPLSDGEARKARIFPGADLFAFSRHWWDRYEHDYPDMLLGAEAWDGVLKELMNLAGFKPAEPIIYHEAHPAFWVQHMLTSRSQIHNRTLAAQWIHKHGVPDFLCRPPRIKPRQALFSGAAVRQGAVNKAQPPSLVDRLQPKGRSSQSLRDVEKLRRVAGSLAFEGRFEQATRLLGQLVRLTPRDAAVHKELGDVRDRMGQTQQAIQSYRYAVRLRPDFHQAWTALGTVLFAAGEIDEAFEACQKGIDLQPDYGPSHNAMGTLLSRTGRQDEALAAFKRATELTPDNAPAHANYGLELLRLGDFANGWKEHEWRLKLQGRPRAGRAWDGSDPSGKTLLLYAEGGLGDAIHFSRFVTAVHDRGARVVLECQDKLIPLLSTVRGVSKVVARGEEPPPYHEYCSLVSLPALLGTTLQTIPPEVPYIQPELELVQRWRPVMEDVPGFRIGVCWLGDPQTRLLLDRSFDAMDLAPLADVPGVKLISIQYGEAPRAGSPILTLPGLEPEPLPLTDVAAVMQHLDLIVCCDTGIAHLAGALGRPVWIALKSHACWRWMLNRGDSPWYPSMRLFRQPRKDDWPNVFSQMAEALRQQLSGKPISASPPILAPLAPGELIDRLSILAIKAQRLTDAAKLKVVQTELDALRQVRDKTIPKSAQIEALAAELLTVNQALWQIEDDIRGADASGDFGPRYVELARSIYRTNDHRSRLKQRINALLGSTIHDVKLYQPYNPKAT